MAIWIQTGIQWVGIPNPTIGNPTPTIWTPNPAIGNPISTIGTPNKNIGNVVTNPIQQQANTQQTVQTLGRVAQVASKEPIMKQAIANLVSWEDGASLLKKFPELTPTEWKPLLDFTNDVIGINGITNSLDSISEAYPELTPWFKQQAYDYIKWEQNKVRAASAWPVQNALWWLFSSLSSPMQLAEMWLNKMLWENDTRMRDAAQNISWGDPNSTAWWISKWVWDIAQMLTPSELAVTEGLAKIPALANLVKNGSTIAKVTDWLTSEEKARPAIQKIVWAIATSIPKWAIDAVKFEAIANHKAATPEEALTFWLLNLALWHTIPWIINFGGELIKEGVGKLTGTSAKTIETAVENAGNPEYTQALRWKISSQDTLENFKNASSNLKEEQYWNYKKSMDAVAKNNTPVDLQWAAEDIIKNLESKNISIPVDNQGNYVLNGKMLNFSKSTVSKTSDQQQIRTLVDELRNWNDTSGIGADTLKQRIGNLATNWADTKLSDAIIYDASNKIWTKIQEAIPEYANAMKEYSKTEELKTAVKQALSIKNKTNNQTAITKIMNYLNENKDYAQAVTKELQKYSTSNLWAQVAGQSLNPLLPKWLVGRMEMWLWAWAWFMHLLSPQIFIPMMATSSPRVVWEMANILWISSKVLENAIKYLPKNAVSRTASLWIDKYLSTNNQ